MTKPSIIRRAVFSPRNSVCGSTRVRELSKQKWWTDNSDPASLYIHACHQSDKTYHRVWPRPIPGYVCKRLEMKWGTLIWMYDATGGRR